MLYGEKNRSMGENTFLSASLYNNKPKPIFNNKSQEAILRARFQQTTEIHNVNPFYYP